MYELKGKETEDKQRDSSLRRGHTSNIQRRQIPSSKILRAGQPNIFKAAQRKAEQGKPNRTGLPDTLKLGIENLSGISMDDVRVHYNSSKPAQLQALAYTKGTDIHVAPGQTKHLPHEAWHVVQQKQGRVMPTMRFGGDLINDNPALEREADCMGAKAVQGKFQDGAVSVKNVTGCCVQRQMPEASDFSNRYHVNRDHDSFVSRGSTMTMNEPLPANKKVEALQKISEEAAGIGNKVMDSGMTKEEFFYAVIKAQYKTNRQNAIQSQTEEQKEKQISIYESQIKKLDGNIDVESYMKERYREGLEDAIRELRSDLKPVILSLKYQFRKTGVRLAGGEVGGPGYIVSVEKTRKGDGGSRGHMINPGRNQNNVDTEDSYSNRHELTQGSILGHTYKKSNAWNKRTNIRSKNFDAYTKLAGEGARFQCVRRNIATITDNTVIHANGEDKGVKFSELWKTWSASFGKKYDIPDREIKNRLIAYEPQKQKNTLRINFNTNTEAVPINASDHIGL